jgi:hypothetical protein
MVLNIKTQPNMLHLGTRQSSMDLPNVPWWVATALEETETVAVQSAPYFLVHWALGQLGTPAHVLS